MGITYVGYTLASNIGLLVALGDGDKRTTLLDGINVKSFIAQAPTKAHPKMGEERKKEFEMFRV